MAATPGVPVHSEWPKNWSEEVGGTSTPVPVEDGGEVVGHHSIIYLATPLLYRNTDTFFEVKRGKLFDC